MFIHGREFKRTLAATLSALLLGLSVAVPAMDRDLFSVPGAHIQSRHAPSTHPLGHDHTLCTQVGANHSAPSGLAIRQPPTRTLTVRSSGSSYVPAGASLFSTHRSRAPPTT